MVFTTLIVGTSTILMESEIELTTHNSEAVRHRAVTGSSPTGTLPSGAGTPDVMSKTSTRSAGRLHTTNLVASGLTAIGRTGPVSQLKKFVAVKFVCPY